MLVSECLIRKATLADIDAVIALEQSCYRLPWSRGQFLEELANPVAAIDLCMVDFRIAGYLCSWLIHGEMQILNLATAPDFRRRGIAMQLLNHVFNRGAPGLTTAWLEVREHNHSAIALYQRCGFVLRGRRRHYYPDGEDALLLSRDFEPSGHGESHQ